MSAKDVNVVTHPDTYDRYYAEKLWSWVPEVYRDEDGRLANPGVLRAFIETFAAEAASQRRSIDRLWEDTIVDHASDWAVPYIGALVGTRMLSALNARGRRLDVAKTVAYRRRAGTPYVLEELIHDITGWHGAIVEGFTHLARTRHNYDPDASSPPGLCATPRGGTANLRAPVSGERVDGPFDQYAHLADLRATPVRMGGAMRSPRGLWNIPKLNVHLYRQKAYPLVLVTPYRLDDRRFTIDPSGRDRALFARGVRSFAETPSVRRMEETGVGWTPAVEWQMPAPISCRLLNEAAYQPRTLDVGQIPGALAALVGNTYSSQAAIRAHVLRLTGVAADWSLYRDVLEKSVTPESAKRNLYGADNSLEIGLGGDPASWHVVMAAITAADLSGWAGTGGVAVLPTFPQEVDVLVDPARGRLATDSAVTGTTRLGVPVHHIGAFDAIGAGSYSRAVGVAADADALPFTSAPTEFGAGVIDGAALQTELNAAGAAAKVAAYEIAGSHTLSLTGTGLTLPDTILQAADRTRPYVRLQPAGVGTEFVLTAAAQAKPPDVTIDGLWLGLRPAIEDSIDQALADPADPAAPEVMTLALAGDFGTVRLSRMTLDPGGETARWDPDTARPIPAVRLELRGAVDRLVIDRSIVGSIVEITDGASVCSIGGIEIADSIVVEAGDGDPAIATELAPVQLVRTTVLGDVRVNRLDASETIVTGYLIVSDSQNGCFRHSAARRGGDDPLLPDFQRLPQQYKSKLIDRDFAREAFVSLTFGDAGFCQLGPDAGQHLARGAENGGELGAFHRSLAPIRLRDLQIKIDEFKPIHLVGQFILET